MGAFRNEYPITGAELKAGLKVWMNNAWWTITHITDPVDGARIVEVEAKMRGRATVTLEVETIYYADKANTMGHKHSHLLTNDSSTQKGKKFKYPYSVVNTPYGMGNERGDY